MSQQSFSFNIAAGGCATIQNPGAKVLTVKGCSLPLQASMDGGAYSTISQGTVLSGGFNLITLLNTQAVTVTVSGWTGETQVQFSAQDNSAANAGTYTVGNFGQANGAAATGSLPAVDANGFCQITTATKIPVPTLDPVLGHRRQLLTLSVDPAAAGNLQLLDANNNVVMTLTKGSQISLPVDSAFQLKGASVTVGVTVGQVFLSNG